MKQTDLIKQTDRVIELYKTHSLRWIATELHTTPGAISELLKENNVVIRKHKDTAYDRLSAYPSEMFAGFYHTHSIEETCKMFNTHPIAIYKYLRENEITSKHSEVFYRHVNKEELAEYYSNHTAEECAEKYGVEEKEIVVAVQKLKLRKSGPERYIRKKNTIKRELTSEQIKEAVNYLAVKYSVNDIAKILNYTPARISQILHKEQ